MRSVRLAIGFAFGFGCLKGGAAALFVAQGADDFLADGLPEDRVEKQEKVNSVLQEEVKRLEGNNTALRRKLLKLEDAIEMMRKPMSSLTAKMLFVRNYLQDTVQLAEKYQAPQVKQEKQELTPSAFIAALGQEEEHGFDNPGASFLQVAGAGVKMISAGMADAFSEMKAAEEEGKASLEARFLVRDEKMAKREEDLMEQQAQLMERKKRLLEERAVLQAAEATLKSTRKDLEDRWEGIKVFAVNAGLAVGEAVKASEEQLSAPALQRNASDW